jgi:hypothetical protein
MYDILPITIRLDKSINEQFPKLGAITNRLEAQFNFQTLTAGWYGDEKHILAIQLLLESHSSYAEILCILPKLSKQNITVNKFSDDVVSCFSQIEQQIVCHVAITEKEIPLLDKQPQILMNFIEIKLHKVLNLIAKQHQLSCF